MAHRDTIKDDNRTLRITNRFAFLLSLPFGIAYAACTSNLIAGLSLIPMAASMILATIQIGINRKPTDDLMSNNKTSGSPFRNQRLLLAVLDAVLAFLLWFFLMNIWPTLAGAGRWRSGSVVVVGTYATVPMMASW